MLANSPRQSLAKTTQLQIQTLKTWFPSLKSLETFIEQRWLKQKCAHFYFSEILTDPSTHPNPSGKMHKILDNHLLPLKYHSVGIITTKNLSSFTKHLKRTILYSFYYFEGGKNICMSTTIFIVPRLTKWGRGSIEFAIVRPSVRPSVRPFTSNNSKSFC